MRAEMGVVGGFDEPDDAAMRDADAFGPPGRPACVHDISEVIHFGQVWSVAIRTRRNRFPVASQ